LFAQDFAGFITNISIGVILPALQAGSLRWHLDRRSRVSPEARDPARGLAALTERRDGGTKKA
jgi:hypothetical protein